MSNGPGSILGKNEDTFLLHDVQTTSGPTQLPIQSVPNGQLRLLLQ
jgi:hypothetical protein